MILRYFIDLKDGIEQGEKSGIKVKHMRTGWNKNERCGDD
jgi:hypothetical protein